MAVEKSKVIARIKAIFPKTNLTAQRLDAIAAKLAEKPEDGADDDAIDAVINDFNENSYMTLEEIAKNDDRLRTLARKAATPDEPSKKVTKAESEEPNDDDPTAVLLRELRSMREEISGLKAENQQKSIEERFKGDERLKDIPAAMLKGRIPKKEEDIESSIEELVSDWTEISGGVESTAQQGKLAKFGKDAPPAGRGQSSAGQVSEKEAEEIAKLLV